MAYRVIVVGLGNQGENWVKAVLNDPDIEYAAFVEVNEQRLEEIREKYSLSKSQMYTDVEQAIKESDAHFLVDVTPPKLHEKISSLAFDRGLHVLGEKPIAHDLSTAKNIIRKSNEANCLYMVSQNYRFHPLARTTRRLIDEGKIDKPEYADIAYFRGRKFPSHLYYNWIDYPLITDMSIHHFDLMRYLLKADPISVYAVSRNPSWSWYKGDVALSAVLQFEGDVDVTYHASWCSTGKQSTLHGDWRIEGKDGALVWDQDELTYYVGDTTQMNQEKIALDRMEYTDQAYAIREMMRSIEEGRQPECSGEDNIKSLAVVFAVLKSVKENRPILIEEVMKEV